MNDSAIKRDVPKDTQNIVVFVHGFGVRWDSLGMFVDIKAGLPEDCGTILFDLYEIEDQDIYVATVKKQVEKLKQVVTETNQTYPHATIHVIAHSMGCIITALAKPKVIGKIILLAPPDKSFAIIQREYFESCPNAIKTDSEIIVSRKDGARIHIPLGFFDELEVLHPESELKKLSENHPFLLIQTTKDEVVGSTSYESLQHNDHIAIVQLSSDHNFTGANREKLVSLIKENIA